MATMGAASIALMMMVSMEALLLLVAAAGTTAASGDTSIRLPSDARAGVADLVRAMAKANKQGDKSRPFECCDSLLCTMSLPAFCICTDVVERCSDACEKCEQAGSGSGYVCADSYKYFPGRDDPVPSCHGYGDARGGVAAADDEARQAAAAAVAVVADDKEGNDDDKRPWECCDLGVCTLSMPPMCRCFDKLDRCPAACKQCEETEDSRHICTDMYKGDPGPRCHGLADKKKERPWKCCDMPICTRSIPPICRCADTVQRCASTCEHCELVEEGSESGGPRYRCLDAHSGDPGPSCGGDHDWARRLARGHAYRF